jgi:hypothetical protein
MGNTDKFEMIANIYDTSERIQIAKVSSDAIREYLVDAKSKKAIDLIKRDVCPQGFIWFCQYHFISSRHV